MKIFITLNKYLLAGFWLVFVTLLLAPYLLPISAESSQWVNWIGILLLVVHLLEFFIKRNTLKVRGHSGVMNFVLVMLFGIIYWKPLLEE